MEEDRLESRQRFSHKSKHAQQDKMERTAILRAGDAEGAADIESLPIGQVAQVYSRFIAVDHPTGQRICVVRKTLTKLSGSAIVVGDEVRFRDSGTNEESGRPEAVIEQVLPRRTILTRADSFAGRVQHPIVANAEQMLIVVSFRRPAVKWGLVDRMLVAAQSGKLKPLLCLNKIDLAEASGESRTQFDVDEEALANYRSLGVVTFLTSADRGVGFEAVRAALVGRTTVLAGHSGVGKSTLIGAIQPGLKIRVGAVSEFNEKGRHVTTSAQRYALDGGGYVIDTPGVREFGLWDVNAENLAEFFPDVRDGTAPPWRVQSYQRIKDSL
jgi:ribosome biogenesis GTPase